jgi:hypothetical protein
VLVLVLVLGWVGLGLCGFLLVSVPIVH